MRRHTSMYLKNNSSVLYKKNDKCQQTCEVVDLAWSVLVGGNFSEAPWSVPNWSPRCGKVRWKGEVGNRCVVLRRLGLSRSPLRNRWPQQLLEPLPLEPNFKLSARSCCLPGMPRAYPSLLLPRLTNLSRISAFGAIFDLKQKKGPTVEQRTAEKKELETGCERGESEKWHVGECGTEKRKGLGRCGRGIEEGVVGSDF